MTTRPEMLAFDEEMGRKLEAVYQTPHAIARRRAALDAIAPTAGERGLDIGPGPGFLACELAERIGPMGRLVAIDVNPAMLALTERRADDRAGNDRVRRWPARRRATRAPATGSPACP